MTQTQKATYQLSWPDEGTYKAEVTGLTHDTYTWNSSLDADNPDTYTTTGAAAAAPAISAKEISKEISKPTVLLQKIKEIPKKTALLHAYPSPANPETWIPYKLSKSEQVIVKIFDVKGTLIRTLDLGQKPAGSYVAKDKAAHGDGRNAYGERVSSGIYFYEMKAGKFRAVKKMLILK